MKRNKGFTLIELLVVIAIIGILASVVLASLNSARNKNADASIKSQLNQARTQADLFYSTGSTYNDVCNPTSDTLNPRGINLLVLNAAKVGGLSSVSYNIGGTITTASCNSTPTAWAAEVPLKNTAGSMYCVDYTRKGIVTNNTIGNNAFCS